jgi:PAS domain S-box-containing protein
MPQFLSVVIPLTAVFVLGFFLEYRAQMGTEQAGFFTQETAVIQRGVRRVEREFEIASGDVRFVADLVSEALDSGRDRLAGVERSLLALARHRPGYAQIRYIDTTGQEILRVESGASGPRVVPESALQNKGERDYFAQTIALTAGEVFVSRMDLNIEHGAIEEPFAPVIRLATPVDDRAGRRRGIAVVNADGDHFLRAFPRNEETGGVQRMIVDSDGYWLQHRPEFEWGFMLPHGLGFQRTFPEIWEPMRASRRGRLESPDGLFYFDAVAAQPPGGPDGDAGQFWMLISLVPSEILDGITVRVGTRLLVIAVPLYFTLLGIGWLLAGALERRRAADEAVRTLEYVRSSMMTAALDAIIVMDQTGTTLEFNPAAQMMFGYTLAEARGQQVADLIIPPAHREAHHKGLARYVATGEGRIIDQHITEMTGIRKDGSEIPVELTICPMRVAGRQLFCGFLRDLSPEKDGDSSTRSPSDPEW